MRSSVSFSTTPYSGLWRLSPCWDCTLCICCFCFLRPQAGGIEARPSVQFGLLPDWDRIMAQGGKRTELGRALILFLI